MNAHEYMRAWIVEDVTKKWLNDLPMAKPISGRYYGFYAGPPGKMPGEERIPWSLSQRSELNRKAEKILEEVRKEKFPYFPSRIGSKMVCPTVSAARSWIGGSSTTIYMVRCTGKIVMLDAELYTRVIEGVMMKLPGKDIRAMAEDYWSTARAGDPEYREVLVSGSVKIMEVVA